LKIAVADLDRQTARVQFLAPQPGADFLHQFPENFLHLAEFFDRMLEGGFIADGVVVSVLARRGSVKVQIALRHARPAQKIADYFNAFLIECAARFRSDARNHFDAERREKILFRTGGHVNEPARFCQGGRDLGR
jgi:hypothetical protein